MLELFSLCDGKLVEAASGQASVSLYTAPDEAQRRYLVDTLKIDEHTLNCALDPNEPARIEFEPGHVAMIMKRPKNYSSSDNFLFRVSSLGIFLFKDQLVLVLDDKALLFEGRKAIRFDSLQDVVLKLFARSILHFEEHLKVINDISDSIEQEINTAMENKHLLNLFTLEKSLVYYLNAILSNAIVIDKLKASGAKLGFTTENIECIDDIVVENNQCHQQASIYSNILASLMDARASIVANNLNVLMKKLNIIMVALMLPTLVVSIFSMNLTLPVNQQHASTFWLVLALAGASVLLVYLMFRKKN